MFNSNRKIAYLETEGYEFCPTCGKLLEFTRSEVRCPKCGFIRKNGDASTKSTPIIEKTTELHNVKDGETKKTQSSTNNKSWEYYFPYIKIRPLQRQIIDIISKCYEKRAHSIVQAANGIGKTIATLSPLLQYTINENKTIVYCCRTHQQLSRVISELKMIKQLAPVTGIALRGRRELCLHPIIQKYSTDSTNAAEICRYLKKDGKCIYFANLAKKDKLKKLAEITANQVFDSKDLMEISKTLEVCPFEVSKNLVKDVNVVTASYQYLFNPHIRTTFLNSLEKDLSDIIIVIDEAHNLPSTAIDASSSTLSNYTLDRAMDEALKLKQGTEYDVIEAISSVLKDSSKELDPETEVRIDPNDFLRKVEKRSKIEINSNVVHAIGKLGELVKNDQAKRNKAPIAFSSAVERHLEHLLESKDRHDYAHFISMYQSKRGDSQPKLISLSLDPRTVTEEIFSKVYCSVSLSGTLDPIESYISLIGMQDREILETSLPSPYDKENVFTIVVDKVSTKLADRNKVTFSIMVKAIEDAIKATPKNVGIFCASYSILNSLIDAGLEKVVSKPLYIAMKGMSSKESDELIQKYKNEAKKTGGVLLSVLGGRASEGSDYPSEQMHTVIIVGIPYARPCPTVDASIEYLESRFPTKGREFGYNIPALTRASQAAGRPIRSLEDYAVVILLDYRFARYYYKKHIPLWLTQNLKVVQPKNESIYMNVKKFFEYHYD